MCNRSILPYKHTSTTFFLLYSISLNRYTLFNLLSVNGHLNCFRFVVCFLYTLSKNAAVNFLLHNRSDQFLAMVLPSQRICISNFDSKITVHKVALIDMPYQQCMLIHRLYFCFVSLMLKQYLVILFCISLGIRMDVFVKCSLGFCI